MARKSSPKSPLTPKQQRFVEEYLVDLNATQAAIRAGYSRRTARAIGAENLTKPDIAAAIASAKEERAERVRVNAAWVVKRLVIEAQGEKAGVRVRALELIGKHKGMFVDKIEHTGDGGGPIEVQVYIPANGRPDHAAPAAGSTRGVPGEPG